ncbi:MAG: pentapeptide repeat-containing protein [Rhodospirillales bacterium]|nr:pentapeptide repeat-containing protein [Rhodospirillales bacterium]MBO6786528.1 pentapeptide repeat-containing protein [Rhodospirillales bacterium]
MNSSDPNKCAYHLLKAERGVDMRCGFSAPASHFHDDKFYCAFHAPVALKKDWTSEAVKEFNASVVDLMKETAASGHECDLTGIVFPHDVDLSKAVSKPDLRVSFRDATFPGAVSFRDATFHHKVTFEYAKFCGPADFGNSTFRIWGDFRRTAFAKDADFSSAVFDGWAHFTEAKFIRAANFDNARFTSSADFTSDEFDPTAFSGWADFTEAGLSATSDFNEVEFFGLADFASVEFGKCFFRNCTFDSIVDFRNAIFHRNAFFNSAAFNKEAMFSNCEFGAMTKFRNARFMRPPKFHNASLHHDTDFVGAYFEPTKTDDAARTYRVLKLAMEETRARDDEADFHAIELKIREALPTTPRAVRWVSQLYGFGSDYGRRIERPILLLIGVIALFTLIFLVISGYDGQHSTVSAFQFSMLQIVRPFFILIPGAEASYGDWARELLTAYPLLVRLIALTQSVLAITLIALLLLAVRRKFRM